MDNTSRRWPLRIVVGVALVLLGWWIAQPRIEGAPDWLESLGLLRWLRKLDPLDKWAGVLATFGAVLVALFQDRLRALLLRARLGVRIESGVEIPWGSNAAYHFRLGVSCEGAIAASLVELLVTEVWKNGQPFAWSQMALRWTDGNAARREVLSGGTTRLCDFLMVEQPGPQAEGWMLGPGGIKRQPEEFNFRSQAFVRIMTSVDPNGRPNALLPSTYVIGLELSAENASPTKRFFEVTFDGRWEPDPAATVSLREVDPPE
jgi:hypothetical protein